MPPQEDTTLNLRVGFQGGDRPLSKEERRKLRLSKRVKAETGNGSKSKALVGGDAEHNDGRFLDRLANNEDELLNFVAQVNRVFEDVLRKPAPFMTFVFCGMQSAGKSTIMERFMNAVLNIVQEGTGTRCPLDCTCIHDVRQGEPICELYGDELDSPGKDLSVNEVFARITTHNKNLGKEDRFSTSPLRLIFRSPTVQNMRFVDTPGIISNQSAGGRDNRNDIKKIIESEMNRPNTKLCVLLEPKEFATNPIVQFCDDKLGREKWINNAIFLMTKFDKQMEDSRTGSKANGFFKEFHQNSCYPYLVATPTLDRENLPSDKLFKARQELLDSADEFETNRFKTWREGHAYFRAESNGEDELLEEKIQAKIGFPAAKKKMREIMLEDTMRRLPEVVAMLRRELDSCRNELAVLLEKQRFTDPQELKVIVNKMLYETKERLTSYLDGDIGVARDFPERLQSLDDEIEEEEESDWSTLELNFHTAKENKWRTQIAVMDEYPDEIQADKKFLGGKQVQRAIEFFRVVMIEGLPDPFELKNLVPNGVGYLSGGLQRENWEGAMVQITAYLMKDVSHPGINYVVKHIGSILRRLFVLALEDIKKGEKFSATFNLIPEAVERFISIKFDDMLLKIMKDAADKMHCGLEPMYSTIDLSLPTFHTIDFGVEEEEEADDRYALVNGQYVKVKTQKEKRDDGVLAIAKQFLNAVMTSSGKHAKDFLKTQNRERACTKKAFLPDKRTGMIIDEETDVILKRSFEYLVALMEFNLINFRFQVNHYLYNGFKEELGRTFVGLGSDADWSELVQPDPKVASRIEELEEQIAGVSQSLQEVQRLSHRLS